MSNNSRYKVKLNTAAVRNLLRSQEVANYCESIANNVVSRCGSGYSTDTYVGKNRVNVAVYPTTRRAARDNYDNNTLLKAVSSR